MSAEVSKPLPESSLPPTCLIRVAVPAPIRRLFDYLPAAGQPLNAHQPGCRVLVPFGRKMLVGIIVESQVEPSVAVESFKPIQQVLDSTPLIGDKLLRLCRWSADYYQHPLGEVLHAALPTLLRQPDPPNPHRTKVWRCRPGASTGSISNRARRQRELFVRLKSTESGIPESVLRQQGFSATQWTNLEEMGLLECYWEDDSLTETLPSWIAELPLPLNPQQKVAIDQLILAEPSDCFLLYGVTGSGKTEVYLQWIQLLLDKGQQVLVLIPEISLSPQTLARFQRRFGSRVCAYHSGLSDQERWRSWRAMREGKAQILIGTRSAIFLSFQNLGAILVDEEHDASFKQQEGFRYSARDLALVRGKVEAIPVLLGSATPSLESLRNVETGKYKMLRITIRAGGAAIANTRILDVRSRPLVAGLSTPLIEQIQETLARGEQTLVFINRRGFAPVLMCHDCGWIAVCQHCDARLTLHRQAPPLRCHHCDFSQHRPDRCPQCQSRNLLAIGAGTERSEEELQRLFPETPVYRIDSETARARSRFKGVLQTIQQGQPAILVGTQMLAKGHHFPNVTLVAIVNADSALFSSDFRATERLAQTLIQVSGRAGRAGRDGHVILQSHHADHPLVQAIATQNYLEVARQMLSEREQTQLPPFSALALLRCEAPNMQAALDWLQQRRQEAEDLIAQRQWPQVHLAGPFPAIMERRAGRYRAQLQINAASRAQLRALLNLWIPSVDQQRLDKRQRWSIDVDPADTF